MKEYNIAVVGATGMVGNKFLEVLTERKLPVKNYYLYASAKSAGKVINFMGKDHTVLELKEENIKQLKILERDFDFRPQTDIEKGLYEFAKWYKGYQG